MSHLSEGSLKKASCLWLADFIDLSTLAYKEHLPALALELLGENLKTWLDLWLSRFLPVQPLEGSREAVNLHSPLARVSPKAHIEGRVYLAEGAIVEPFSYIQGPAYIGPGSVVRHGAYIRGQVFVGKGCVVGHTTEVKGSVFFDGAKAGHFAYVGDSILGREVNLGAGTKLANLKLRGNLVSFQHPLTRKKESSGLKKMGAILGDFAQTGCNAVLSPGSLLMPNSSVFPCVHHHGTLERGGLAARM